MKENSKFIRLATKHFDIDCLRREIDEFGTLHGLPRKLVFQLTLILEELITNVIKYGYQDEDEHKIDIRLTLQPGVAIVRVKDDGQPFNPLDAPKAEAHGNAEKRKIGGMGIHLLRNLMDTIEYERLEDQNVLCLTKRF